MKPSIQDLLKNYHITENGYVFSFKNKKILSTFENHNGYLKVNLSFLGKEYHYFIHQLVALVYVPNKLNKPYVNHKDSNRKNNTISNLEWCTNKENSDHAKRKYKPTYFRKINSSPIIVAINIMIVFK